jgi:hypothetical protein
MPTTSKVTCLVCAKECDRKHTHIVVLSEQERKHLNKPRDEYIYCVPCWRVLSDPKTAPDFISGLMLLNLRQLGVPNAKELSTKLKHWLIARSVRKS